MTDRYAVIGNPIGHSRSPDIHAAFAQQTGQAIDYQRLLGGLDSFADDIQAFRAAGGKGLNVTVPFKEQAYALADQVSSRAQAAKAVNTLIFQEDGIQGDNTDGVGLVRDLTLNHQCNLAGARILLLGAGGAARGVLLPLLQTEPTCLVIANRTASKAHDLATTANSPAVTGGGLDELNGQTFEIIINATAAGLQGKVPPIPAGCLAPGGWTYDMLYAQQATAFVRWGQQHGAAKTLGGWGMLVEQAAESFRLWRGVTPDTTSVIHSLR